MADSALAGVGGTFRVPAKCRSRDRVRVWVARGPPPAAQHRPPCPRARASGGSRREGWPGWRERRRQRSRARHRAVGRPRTTRRGPRPVAHLEPGGSTSRGAGVRASQGRDGDRASAPGARRCRTTPPAPRAEPGGGPSSVQSSYPGSRAAARTRSGRVREGRRRCRAGTRRAAARELRGWTQEELADRLALYQGQRMTQAGVSAIERAWDGERRREFDAHELLIFALVFDLPIISFLLPPPGDRRMLRATTRPVNELYSRLLGFPEQLVRSTPGCGTTGSPTPTRPKRSSSASPAPPAPRVGSATGSAARRSCWPCSTSMPTPSTTHRRDGQDDRPPAPRGDPRVHHRTDRGPRLQPGAAGGTEVHIADAIRGVMDEAAPASTEDEAAPPGTTRSRARPKPPARKSGRSSR